ncbi:glycosyltransferase [Variovorax sp. J22P271]|uniref:glycosyltransferase n=1 Tax=Variovorax davisae TaxID=3053515 RepID=UPI002578E963|nr:glycosyltransferase [Variovorax sp. J22P271]MDM0033287.1 glycosyltransferase [Variovorax sp. J22P271]
MEAPIWDCEGIAFLLEKRWPLVTSLQTTLHFWLESHPQKREDGQWMLQFGAPMLTLERELMMHADGVRAISSAIRTEIEHAYGFRFDPTRLHLVPLGLAPIVNASMSDNCAPVVLFVGRLEARKGIDTLLKAIPGVLDFEPRTLFRIVGDHSLTDENGKTYAEEFRTSAVGRRWATQVIFEGRVDDATLRAAYATCDLFVAPSRFESFGLVFLEAMRARKPVVGCDVGGIPEVVAANESGLLVQSESIEELTAALLKLLRSKALRRDMGAAGGKIFDERFTSHQMAQCSVEMYRSAQRYFLQACK